MFSRYVRRAAIALAIFVASFPALAQQYQNIPAGTVLGRSQINSGPAQAIPFSQLMALIGNVNTTTVTAGSVVYKGSTSGQATISAQAVAGTPTIKWPTTSGTVPSTATSPIQLDATTGIISCPSCVTLVSGGIPVVASRTLAASQNLSTLNAIQTLGYASAGDGGGATFKNVGSAAFIDSGIVTGSYAPTAGGIGYTTGVYYGVFLTGGTGTGVQANVTVQFGAVSNVTVTGTGGNGYTVGDVLSAPAALVGGTGSGFTWTVPAVTTPLASFTDSAGTHWQYITDLGNFPNIRQFGAKQNYTAAGGDAGATDDKPAVQAALNFAGHISGSPDAGGFQGNTVLVPQGGAKICGGLQIPTNVILSGVSNGGSLLKECDSDDPTTNFIVLGDPLNRQTSFFLGIWNMTLFGASSGSGGGATMIFTNSAQAPDGVKNVSVYPIYRTCVSSNTGYGGPSIFRITGSYFIPNTSATPGCISLNHASNQVIDGGTWFSVGGAPWGGTAISIASNGASVNRLVDIHCENLSTCVLVNVPAGGSGTMTTINGMVGNATVTNLINRAVGSASGQLRVDFSAANGSTCTVFNAGSCAATANVFGATY